jgi:hypothetical protein
VTSRVVGETPWKPATRDDPVLVERLVRSLRAHLDDLRLRVRRVGDDPRLRAVSETASWPRSWIAIAQSAFEMRSPVETSMSYSRGCGGVETSCASRISSSVVSPIAESTPTTVRPSRVRRRALRDALQLVRVADRRTAELHHDDPGVPRRARDGGDGFELGGRHNQRRVAPSRLSFSAVSGSDPGMAGKDGSVPEADMSVADGGAAAAWLSHAMNSRCGRVPTGTCWGQTPARTEQTCPFETGAPTSRGGRRARGRG